MASDETGEGMTDTSPLATPDSPRVLVTLCTYNERENIEPLIAAIHHQAPQVDVLVVDDPDEDKAAIAAE